MQMTRIRRGQSGSDAHASPAISRRTRVVWCAFVGAMTLGCGLLLALESRPAPRSDGLALVATTSTNSIEGIFKTRAGEPIEPGRWKAIVIHHSGEAAGSPATIAREHEARNLRGLGHHFIIGNGAGMDDGELHVGYRWLDQLPGAHAAGSNGDWYNLNAISICLVGDGNRRPFTSAQMARLDQLVEALARELKIPRSAIVLHSDIAPASDPGVLFPAARFQQTLDAVR
jgi:N-acetyl-anhydromuramyl-L-alanine amidase AmpD